MNFVEFKLLKKIQLLNYTEFINLFFKHIKVHQFNI